jgi:tetratricopeptide (TPR) repeat protein
MPILSLARLWRSAATLGLLLSAMVLAPGISHAATATWLRAESPHFVVYGSSTQQKVRDYVLMLEDFDTLLRITYGRKLDEPVPRKLDVYLARDLSELRRVNPEATTGMLGFYWTSDDDIFAVAVQNSAATADDRTKGDDVILHEYVHHFMMQYYPSAYPAWIMEGFAEYYATADLGKTKLTVGDVNAQRARTLVDSWLPISAILTRTVEETPEAQQNSYYAEAWILTHYILSDPQRSRRLAPYLNLVRAHKDPLVAWQEIYGQDAKALDAALSAYIDKPLLSGFLMRSWQAPAITVTTLSPGAGAVLLESQQAKMLQPGARSGSNCLTFLRNGEQKYPDDHFVKLARVRAEGKFGDRAQADAALEKMIAANPDDAEALRLLGTSKLTAGRADPAKLVEDFTQASALLQRAVKLEPDNYQGLYHYAESRSVDRSFSSYQALEILLKAVDLAPQLPGLRLAAAQMAMRSNQFEAARAMLVPVVGAPHGGAAARIGRGMMTTLDMIAAAQAGSARAGAASTAP